jgi:hypothetical protein
MQHAKTEDCSRTRLDAAGKLSPTYKQFFPLLGRIYLLASEIMLTRSMA